jgi:hypothetical protein
MSVILSDRARDFLHLSKYKNKPLELRGNSKKRVSINSTNGQWIKLLEVRMGSLFKVEDKRFLSFS